MRKATGPEDGYSGFTVRHPDGDVDHATRLGPLLQAAGVTDIVIVGLATDYCVLATALDAVRRGFARDGAGRGRTGRRVAARRR